MIIGSTIQSNSQINKTAVTDSRKTDSVNIRNMTDGEKSQKVEKKYNKIKANHGLSGSSANL